MESKWIQYKDDAIALRRQGFSMRTIEKKYGIARSTLSGWFKKVKLTKKQKEILRMNTIKAWNEKTRQKAVAWHNKQKQDRLATAKSEALHTFSRLNINDKNLVELALAFLYLGEGTKTDTTSLGNSNPQILNFFIKCLESIYTLNRSNFKYYLHLRFDQDENILKKYWAEKLDISLDRFGKTIFDKRTMKSETYPHYKGVCVVECGNVAIQRKLVFLSQEFCDKITGTDD